MFYEIFFNPPAKEGGIIKLIISKSY